MPIVELIRHESCPVDNMPPTPIAVDAGIPDDPAPLYVRLELVVVVVLLFPLLFEYEFKSPLCSFGAADGSTVGVAPSGGTVGPSGPGASSAATLIVNNAIHHIRHIHSRKKVW